MEMHLDIVFYLVIGLCVVFYTILDGFDLGVGMLHIFTKKDEERRLFLNAIGPVWDGNEVWLVVVGGALFAGFPEVYATLFSGFYNICMALLFGLIFRAVAIEFRSKQPSTTWRNTWDIAFSIASLMIAFGVGLVLGNLVQGIPLDAHKDYVGTFGEFFGPYPVLLGITSVALFMMHGSIYLVMKTEGELHNRLREWVTRCIIFFAVCYITTSFATLIYMPHMVDRIREFPWLFLIGIAAFLALANVPRELNRKRDGMAFVSSCAGIALLVLLYGIGTFPVFVRSTIDPENYSLTVFNSSSSLLTMKVLMIIVIVGVPLILGYGTYIYRVFRGKVKIGPTSY